MKPFDRKTAVLLALVLANVSLAYWNQFRNGLHLDDANTIASNPSIRLLSDIPRFFSTRAAPTYRPVVSTSFAIDYQAARHFAPLGFWFHATTFGWYAVLLAIVFFLFRGILLRAADDPRALLAALFATAIYGLHPVNAETLNYLTRRADLFATLGVVAGIASYARWPAARRFGLYLLPVVFAALSHPSALVFPALLLAYDFLFEQPGRRWLPALLVSIAMGVLVAAMTPKWFTAGIPAGEYLITQPYVALRYFLWFFLPVHLSAESDLTAFHSAFDPGALLGFAFVAALVFSAWHASKKPEWRPVAFGLWWFLAALVPTAIFPLPQLEASWRMFFPFVGLALAACWTAALLLSGELAPSLRQALVPAAVFVLVALTTATRARNEVWYSEESLWYDTARASPRNGNALLNYGLTQMAQGRYDTALTYFESALPYHPNPHVVEINLGIANSGLHRDNAAETHFRRAMDLAPTDPQTSYYYARWLQEHGRIQDSLSYANVAMAIEPRYLEPRHLAMQIYAQTGDRQRLLSLVAGTLEIAPGDSIAARYLRPPAPPQAPPPAAPAANTADEYVLLSLNLYRAGQFPECIGAARHALVLNPSSAVAYNNIAAAYQSMHQWDQAIQAAEQALRLQPDFELARNNLMWSRAQKEKERGKP